MTTTSSTTLGPVPSTDLGKGAKTPVVPVTSVEAGPTPPPSPKPVQESYKIVTVRKPDGTLTKVKRLIQPTEVSDSKVSNAPKDAVDTTTSSKQVTTANSIVSPKLAEKTPDAQCKTSTTSSSTGGVSQIRKEEVNKPTIFAQNTASITPVPTTTTSVSHITTSSTTSAPKSENASQHQAGAKKNASVANSEISAPTPVTTAPANASKGASTMVTQPAAPQKSFGEHMSTAGTTIDTVGTGLAMLATGITTVASSAHAASVTLGITQAPVTSAPTPTPVSTPTPAATTPIGGPPAVATATSAFPGTAVPPVSSPLGASVYNNTPAAQTIATGIVQPLTTTAAGIMSFIPAANPVPGQSAAGQPFAANASGALSFIPAQVNDPTTGGSGPTPLQDDKHDRSPENLSPDQHNQPSHGHSNPHEDDEYRNEHDYSNDNGNGHHGQGYDTLQPGDEETDENEDLDGMQDGDEEIDEEEGGANLNEGHHNSHQDGIEYMQDGDEEIGEMEEGDEVVHGEEFEEMQDGDEVIEDGEDEVVDAEHDDLDNHLDFDDDEDYMHDGVDDGMGHHSH